MKKNLDLAILCGGRGTRLKELTKYNSKPLIKINNIPFINYIINFYKKFNFNKIYLLLGHKSYLYKKYHNQIINSIQVECIIEKKELGTGGAISQLKNKVLNNFLLVNGDSFLNYNFNKFILNFEKSKSICKIGLIENKNYKSNKKLSNISILNNKNLKFSSSSKLMNAEYIFLKKKFSIISNQTNIYL